MLENLINLVKDNAQNLVVNNAQVPNENNDAVINETGNTIVDGLKNALSGGNLSGVMSLLGGKEGIANNPIVGNIISGLTQTLQSKFNIGGDAAANVANGLVPQVMDNLVSKTNDPNDNSFDLQGILSNIGADKLGNIGDIIGNITGGNSEDGGGIGGMLKNIF